MIEWFIVEFRAHIFLVETRDKYGIMKKTVNSLYGKYMVKAIKNESKEKTKSKYEELKNETI